MSEENMEVVRRGYEALAAGDFHVVLDLLDPGAEIRSARQSPDGGISIGHDGLLANFGRLEEAFEDPRFEVEELVDAGAQVMAIVRMRARGRGSGLEVEQTLAHVWTLRGGKGVALDIYLDRREALQAIGLSE